MQEYKQNLAQCAQQWFAYETEKTLLRTSDKSGTLLCFSREQVYADILAWADVLQKKGIQAGDRIVMISPKSLRHFSFFLSCWHLGAIAVPVCESLSAMEMGFILRDCAPKAILADHSLLKKVQECSGDFPVIDLEEMPAGTPVAQAPAIPAWTGENSATAVLIYTSGSTGQPKGVMLSHKSLIINADSALKFFRITDKDSIVSLLPYWHAYALTCEIVAMMMSHAGCIVPRDIRDFRKNLKTYQPTIMIAVPRIVETIKAGIDKLIAELPEKRKRLVQRAIHNASRIFTAGASFNGGILRILMHHIFYNPFVFSKFRAGLGGKLRFIVCGGAPMDLELQIFFKFIGLPCLVGYGLTEASPIISANRVEFHKLDSCGQIVSWLLPENGGDFTFKDEAGNLGKDLHGQLLVKGDCVMQGYWHHTDASAKTMENGWLNTGDMGYYDKDGFLHIAGRKGNMIVTIGGEKLHPEHVEDAIRLSPYISEVMVIGEKCKNVYALVNVNAEMTKGMSQEEINEKIRQEVQEKTQGLTSLQRPRATLILPTFNQEDGTLTATLKIRRFKIKEKYQQAIEEFLTANGEEIATRHEVGIEHSRIQESLSE